VVAPAAAVGAIAVRRDAGGNSGRSQAAVVVGHAGALEDDGAGGETGTVAARAQKEGVMTWLWLAVGVAVLFASVLALCALSGDQPITEYEEMR
jgi:hypothetical protein